MKDRNQRIFEMARESQTFFYKGPGVNKNSLKWQGEILFDSKKILIC